MSKLSTTTIKYVSLTDSTKLEDYINKVCIDAAKLKDRIQVASIGILMHMGKHGDKATGCRFANQLINGLGQGIQFKALSDFFAKFAGATEGTVVGDDGKNQTAIVDFDLEVIRNEFEEAKKTHWATFAPKPEFRGFNFDDKLEALIKQSFDAVKLADTDSEAADKIQVNQTKLQLLQSILDFSENNAVAMLNQIKGQKSPANEDMGLPEDIQVA